MKLGDIRNRLLLAALLPVLLVVLLLTAVFLTTQVRDINEAHEQQTRFLARQVAGASEYGLFSANTAYLQTIVSGAMRQLEVRTVAILDRDGRILASAGHPQYKKLPILNDQEVENIDPSSGLDVLLQPVFSSQLKLDDLYSSQASSVAETPVLLGHVVMEISHDDLVKRQRAILWVGALVTLAGMLFGGVLAWRLGRGVIRPILRISRMVERLGRGELSVRAAVLPNDPLRDFQQVLNQMAERLEVGRDELEQRVAVVTQALREKKEEAETANQAKSRFLAAASHDLRQPTHALGMFVARLAQLPHDAPTRHLIGSLDAAVNALRDLLDGLLDISRLDAQAVPVQRHVFALSDVFEQLHAGMILSAAEKGLRLRFRPTEVCLLSDPALLHRILLNLVANALRYTQQGGVYVGCRLSSDGEFACIEVVDTGIGIALEHQQTIFKEFFQIDNPERDRSKGLGLGLNIVKRTADLLGHRLQLRSRPGRGTRISIKVPLAPPGAVVNGRPPVEVASSDDLVGLLVLVIDDDALARESLASLLESWGCVVESAEGLSEALWHLKHGTAPDVIVCDYRLRENENGLDVVRQLRLAAGLEIAACLISGDTDPDLINGAKLAGLTLLHKPVRPAKLRSLLRRLAAEVQVAGTDLT
jgi:signal transduction histidine kinase/ActR/RegA family two-component response regulator